MGSLYLNRLTPDERHELVAELHSIQSGNCFICGEKIDLVLHRKSLDIDHVQPTSAGGKDGPENFALTHDTCNRSKQASDLRVARVLCAFSRIQEACEAQNRAPNLGDVLRKYVGEPKEMAVRKTGSVVEFTLPGSGSPEIHKVPLYRDELSGMDYFFANIPISYLHHDDRINPRAIGSNLHKLVEEFHKRIPQLHVALGWVSTNDGPSSRVKVFDGQHKAAAQILLGAKAMPVRVFVNPDLDILLTANTHAGTTHRQIAFDKSVQRSLGSTLLTDRIDRYRQERGLSEGDEGFSERDLVNHFKGESRELKRFILDWVRNAITTSQENKLREYIDFGGRGSDLPFSYSTIEKTFYSFFIHSELLTTRFDHKAEEGLNPRQLEVKQIVRLQNLIAERLYVGKFKLEIGTSRIENQLQKGEDIPEEHVRAFRMAKEEILYNWLRFAKQIVQNYFISNGRPIDESKLFQYEIPDPAWANIDRFIVSLGKLPMWVNRDLSSSIFGGKHNYDFWQSIFDSGATPDGQKVMPKGIDLMDMMKDRTLIGG